MLTIFSQTFSYLIGLMPTVNIPTIVIPSVITNIVNALWYFLPMKTIGGIFGIGAVITLIRFVLAVVVRLKSFIPFMGA